MRPTAHVTTESSAATTQSSASEAFSYRPSLDGLRSFAVYVVVAYHAGMGTWQNGFIGVDVFFVLSGFLVTNVLLSELGSSGSVRLRRFYARRIRRLLPASAALIVGVAVWWSLMVPVTERASVAGDARAAALYVANWRFIATGTDYGAADAAAASPFLHFWSLAIEEQFYVVFPLVLLAAWRWSRSPRRTLVVVLTGLAAASLALQVWLAGSNADRAYFGTDTRLYQLLAGALLAIALNGRVPAIARLRAFGLAAVGLLALILLATPALGVDRSMRGVLAAGASVALLLGLEAHRGGPLHGALSWGPIVQLGQISYGTYLWHWPVVLVLHRFMDLPGWQDAIVVAVVGTALAYLSSHLLELPIRRQRRLDARPRLVIAVGLASSVLVAVVATVALSGDTASRVVAVESGSTGVAVDKALTAELGEAPPDSDWEAVRGTSKNLPPTPNCVPGRTDDCVIVEGTADTVLVVGDSHARMLLPYLIDHAERNDLTLAASIELGCGWAEGVAQFASADSGVDNCGTARPGWTTALVEAIEPDVVVLVQRERLANRFADGLDVFADPEVQALGFRKGYQTVMRRTIASLTEQGVRVVAVEETPSRPGLEPISCLAEGGSVIDCSWLTPLGPAPDEVLLRSLAEEDDLVASLDLDPVACPELPLCAPYLDDQFVYRDGHHVQPDWWTAQTDQLDERFSVLVPSG